MNQEHIVQFVDFADEHAPLLVMEYVSLGDLHYQHAQMLLSTNEVQMLLHQSLGALNYLHDRTITHRNVKPVKTLSLPRQKSKADLLYQARRLWALESRTFPEDCVRDW